jgi:hypothetical protein
MDTLSVIERFNAAFNAHDLQATMSLMTSDCVFENTDPAPDGTRHAGAEAVRAAFAAFFRDSPNAVFTTEDQFACGDRAVIRWRYDWGDGHVRGVDVFVVRDGKIAEKLSYVKG